MAVLDTIHHLLYWISDILCWLRPHGIIKHLQMPTQQLWFIIHLTSCPDENQYTRRQASSSAKIKLINFQNSNVIILNYLLCKINKQKTHLFISQGSINQSYHNSHYHNLSKINVGKDLPVRQPRSRPPCQKPCRWQPTSHREDSPIKNIRNRLDVSYAPHK